MRLATALYGTRQNAEWGEPAGWITAATICGSLGTICGSVGLWLGLGLGLGLDLGLGFELRLGIWLGLRIVVYKLLEKVTKCGSIT